MLKVEYSTGIGVVSTRIILNTDDKEEFLALLCSPKRKFIGFEHMGVKYFYSRDKRRKMSHIFKRDEENVWSREATKDALMRDALSMIENTKFNNRNVFLFVFDTQEELNNWWFNS